MLIYTTKILILLRIRFFLYFSLALFSPSFSLPLFICSYILLLFVVFWIAALFHCVYTYLDRMYHCLVEIICSLFICLFVHSFPFLCGIHMLNNYAHIPGAQDWEPWPGLKSNRNTFQLPRKWTKNERNKIKQQRNYCLVSFSNSSFDFSINVDTTSVIFSRVHGEELSIKSQIYSEV